MSELKEQAAEKGVAPSGALEERRSTADSVERRVTRID